MRERRSKATNRGIKTGSEERSTERAAQARRVVPPSRQAILGPCWARYSARAAEQEREGGCFVDRMVA